MQPQLQSPLPPFEQSAATFETSNLDESFHYMNRTSGHMLKPGSNRSPITFRHWGLSLDHINLDFIDLKCGHGFGTVKTEEMRHYFFQMPISGVCELEIDRDRNRAEPGQIFVVNSEQCASKRWIGQCQQLMLRVEKNALHQVLASELEHDCRKPLAFKNTDQDPAAGMALRSLAFSTWQELMLHVELGQWRIAQSLERSLLVACLGLLRHNYSEEFLAPVAAAAPYYVRRAEEYIRSNLCETIGIDDLVAVAGVSSRSLYYGFRRWRKTTPMSYLRNLRLNLAHTELCNARNSGKRVTDIAMNIGYHHRSRFSRDYKQRFGESPSITMRRAS